MSKQLLIYDRAIPVSSETHRDISVQVGKNYNFASTLNSSPLLAAEFSAAASEYVIVFAGTAEQVFPSIILGLEDGQNLYLDAEGAWKGKYVSAFLRRYPFVFAEVADTTSLTLCVDEEFEGLNSDGKGERLFDSEGNRTRYLASILEFLTGYQGQFERTKLFCARLVNLGVLEAAQARFAAPDGRNGSMTGFFTINREKLKAIPAESLTEMFNTDELELCFLHLQSLGNLSALTRMIDANLPKSDV